MDIWKDVEPYWDAFCNKLKGWGEDILAVWTKIKIFFSALGSVIEEPLSYLTDKTAKFFEGFGAIIKGSSLVSGISDWWNGKTSSSNTVSNIQTIKPRGSDVARSFNINSPITVNVNGADNPTIVANEVTEQIKGYYETLLYDDAVRTI